MGFFSFSFSFSGQSMWQERDLKGNLNLILGRNDGFVPCMIEAIPIRTNTNRIRPGSNILEVIEASSSDGNRCDRNMYSQIVRLRVLCEVPRLPSDIGLSRQAAAPGERLDSHRRNPEPRESACIT